MLHLIAPKRWYVIYTKPQKEELAQFHLKLRNLEPFFPRIRLPVFSRRQKLIVPLFPNYLFVRVDFASEFERARWAPGVKCFVSFNDNPVPVEDGVVEYLASRGDSSGLIVARPDIRSGQEVRICSGPFEGLLGTVEQIPDAKGRVKILMQLLSRQMRVEVPVRFIDNGWVVDNRDASRSLAPSRVQ